MSERLAIPTIGNVPTNSESLTPSTNGATKPFITLDELKVVGRAAAIINPDGTFIMQDIVELQLKKQLQPEVSWYALIDKDGRKYFSHPDYFVKSEDGSGDQEILRFYPEEQLDREILISEGVEI